jgi:hypothetical protein
MEDNKTSVLKDIKEIGFEEVIDNEETKELFLVFLKKEKNMNSFFFMQKVDEYSLLKSEKNRFEKAKIIVKNFFNQNLNNYLNISNDIYLNILEKFKSCNESKFFLFLK